MKARERKKEKKKIYIINSLRETLLSLLLSTGMSDPGSAETVQVIQGQLGIYRLLKGTAAGWMLLLAWGLEPSK